MKSHTKSHLSTKLIVTLKFNNMATSVIHLATLNLKSTNSNQIANNSLVNFQRVRSINFLMTMRICLLLLSIQHVNQRLKILIRALLILIKMKSQDSRRDLVSIKYHKIIVIMHINTQIMQLICLQ